MLLNSRRRATGLAALLLAMAIPVRSQQAQGRGQPQPPPPTLGLEGGTIDFDTPHFRLKLVKASQTIAALEPKGAKGIDAYRHVILPAAMPRSMSR